MVQVCVKLPLRVVEKIDREVARRNARDDGQRPVTRSDVIRERMAR